jgi:transcriptional regulator with PAS, ATPase and Fis domain
LANDTAEQTAAPEPFGFQNIIGESPVLREAVRLALQVAGARRTTVLLIGETGTGKELFARGVHYAGPAANEPFVAINCAAIPDSLLESELFGHERGAFTGAHARKQGLLELAGAGTLFLDEVHHLPPLLQPKLLRALESRQIRRLGGFEEIPIECRVIAAASPILEQVVTSGEFREDLYYRLNVFSISLPPRDRVEDIDVVARHFLNQQNRENHQTKEFAPDAYAALRVHRWPGNVRELKNVVERAAILSGDSALVRAEHLMIQRRTARAPAPDAVGEIRIPPGGKPLDDIVAEAVALTLKLTGGNQAAAARLLGISRPTIAKKMVRPLPLKSSVA